MSKKYLDSTSVKIIEGYLEPEAISSTAVDNLFNYNIEYIYDVDTETGEETSDLSASVGYNDVKITSVFHAFIYVNGTAHHLTYSNGDYYMEYGELGWNHSYISRRTGTANDQFTSLKIYNKDLSNGTCTAEAVVYGIPVIFPNITLFYLDPGTK